MKKYATMFYRLHSATCEKERVIIVVETDVPFDDEHLTEFTKLFWKKLFALYPHWGTGYPLVDGRGWSSALGGNEFLEVK